MARDKLITIRIEGEKRDAFNQLAKSQNTDTASLLYDFISGCLDGRIDISLVTGKGQRIDNQLDDDRLNKIDNRIDKLETTTQRIDRIDIAIQRLDNRIDGIETTTQRLAKRLDDWIEAIDDRLTDCDQGLSEKIITLEHRINALSSQLDRQDRQEIDTMEMTTQEIDNRIDDMEPLLKLQREASIASHSPDEPAIEDSEKKIIELVGGSDSLDTLPVPPITNAIEDLTDQSSSPAKKKGLTDSELARHLGIDKSNITRWKQKGHPTQKYRDKWELRGRFWHEKD
jgi:chromosome segregation ATPase